MELKRFEARRNGERWMIVELATETKVIFSLAGKDEAEVVATWLDSLAADTEQLQADKAKLIEGAQVCLDLFKQFPPIDVGEGIMVRKIPESFVMVLKETLESAAKHTGGGS